MSDTITGTAAKPPRSPAAGRRKVFVRELELMAHVGVYEVEHRYEQRLVVSVDLDVVDAYDGSSDRLTEVLDYGSVVASVQRIVEAEHLNLLETLAERIAQTWLEDPRVQSVRVRLEKPDILPGCRSVGIEIERKRPTR
jgi:dihydroneopterin aldolase